jgi:hypothetical protein
MHRLQLLIWLLPVAGAVAVLLLVITAVAVVALVGIGLLRYQLLVEPLIQ